MGMHGFTPTSPLSAALALCSYIQTLGRVPMTIECRPSAMGMSYRTLYRVLPRGTGAERPLYQGGEWSAIVSAAVEIAGMRLRLDAGKAELEPAPPPAKMRQCIGKKGNGADCTRKFPDQGPHIRKCDQCRKTYHEGDEAIDTMVRRVELQRFGFGRGGLEYDLDEIIDWEV